MVAAQDVHQPGAQDESAGQGQAGEKLHPDSHLVLWDSWNGMLR